MIIFVIASRRVGPKSAFTRVFDALWRRPMTGSAKQSRITFGELDCFVAALLAKTGALGNTRLCRALTEHSLSPQASITNRSPSVTSRARRAHTRFKRWGASQDAGTTRMNCRLPRRCAPSRRRDQEHLPRVTTALKRVVPKGLPLHAILWEKQELFGRGRPPCLSVYLGAVSS